MMGEKREGRGDGKDGAMREAEKDGERAKRE